MQFFTILACSFRRLFSSTSVFLSLRIFSRSSIAEKRIRYFVTSKLQIKEFGHTIKEIKLYETSDCLTRDTLNFQLLEKGLGLFSPPHFCMIFQEKHLSYYILLTDQISLPDCLYFLRYRVICNCNYLF